MWGRRRWLDLPLAIALTCAALALVPTHAFSSPLDHPASGDTAEEVAPPSTTVAPPGDIDRSKLRKPTEKDELLLVHSIWRHGDRTPVFTFPTDPIQEEAWPQGFGQLTTRGMSQHVQLGKFLRKRYVDELNLLHKQYRGDQIYVTSTDTNRTIQSAMANMVGMWSGASLWGVDYPDIPDWPPFYMPVPVHTYEYRRDPVGKARASCQRTFELYDLSTRTTEFRTLNESNIELLQRISEYAGMPITLANLWIVIEAVKIEKAHGMRPVDWATEILQQMTELNLHMINFNSGIGLSPLFGVDFSLELPKVVGGAFLWEIITRMQHKVECTQLHALDEQETPLCKWLLPLKYHAHSTHDMTLVALFSTFNFTASDFDRDGFPGYASCLLVELWRRADGDGHYVKLFYRRDDQQLVDVTPSIEGCEDHCSLERFAERSLKYKPEPNQETFCHTPVLYQQPPPQVADSAGALTRTALGAVAVLLLQLAAHALL